MTLFAVAIGIDQIVIEGDSKMVMNQVKSDFHFSQFGHIIQEAQALA